MQEAPSWKHWHMGVPLLFQKLASPRMLPFVAQHTITSLLGCTSIAFLLWCLWTLSFQHQQIASSLHLSPLSTSLAEIGGLPHAIGCSADSLFHFLQSRYSATSFCFLYHSYSDFSKLFSLSLQVRLIKKEMSLFCLGLLSNSAKPRDKYQVQCNQFYHMSINFLILPWCSRKKNSNHIILLFRH